MAKFKIGDIVRHPQKYFEYTATIIGIDLVKRQYRVLFSEHRGMPHMNGEQSSGDFKYMDKNCVKINSVDYNKFWTKFNEAQI